MEKYKILIRQNMYQLSTGEVINQYHFALQNGLYLGVLRLPADRQFMFDDKMLAPICKALSMRWGIIKGNTNK